MIEVIAYKNIKDTNCERKTVPVTACVLKPSTAAALAAHKKAAMAGDKDAGRRYTVLKSKQPCFTPSNSHPARGADGAVYTGILTFDYDPPKKGDYFAAKKASAAWLAKCKKLGAVYGGYSASGCGAYVAFYVPECPGDADGYRSTYAAVRLILEDQTGVDLDQSTCDISRVRFFGATCAVWVDDLKAAHPYPPEGARNVAALRAGRKLAAKGYSRDDIQAAAAAVTGNEKARDSAHIADYVTADLYSDARAATVAAVMDGVVYRSIFSDKGAIINCNTGKITTGGNWQDTTVYGPDGKKTYRYTIGQKGKAQERILTYGTYLKELDIGDKTCHLVALPYKKPGACEVEEAGVQYRAYNQRPIYFLEKLPDLLAKADPADKEHQELLATQFLYFMRHQLGDYFAAYCAWIVNQITTSLKTQKPQTPRLAWLFLGDGGTGKSTFIDLPRLLLGPGGINHAKEGDEGERQYSQGLCESLFYTFPEANVAQDKEIISSDFVRLEKKYVNSRETPNCSAYSYTSNDYSVALQIAADSGLLRRYIVVNLNKQICENQELKIKWLAQNFYCQRRGAAQRALLSCQSDLASGAEQDTLSCFLDDLADYTYQPEFLQSFYAPDPNPFFVAKIWDKLKKTAAKEADRDVSREGLYEACALAIRRKNDTIGVLARYFVNNENQPEIIPTLTDVIKENFTTSKTEDGLAALMSKNALLFQSDNKGQWSLTPEFYAAIQATKAAESALQNWQPLPAGA